jgi:hemerythrin superfamily protein
MDAITLLKNDHDEVSKLFKKYEDLGDGATKSKQDLVDKIMKELTTHAFIEEEIFYPFAQERVPKVEDDVKEGVAEHHLIEVTLAELATMGPDNDDFDARVTVLKEVVEHHVDEEEDDWFPKVREAIGRNDLAEVGERMEAAKADAPEPPPDPSS